MMNADDIIKILKAAQEMGLIEASKPKEAVPIEQAYQEVSILDGVTDEELLYWSTPYYDFLQEQKQAKKERLAEEEELRNG
jgi:hypothetical protein